MHNLVSLHRGGDRLCSRVNRRESALPDAQRELIFAALTSYASEFVSTATRAVLACENVRQLEDLMCPGDS